jgi:hypothetical protein
VLAFLLLHFRTGEFVPMAAAAGLSLAALGLGIALLKGQSLLGLAVAAPACVPLYPILPVLGPWHLVAAGFVLLGLGAVWSLGRPVALPGKH